MQANLARSQNFEKRLLASSCLSVRPHEELGSYWTDFHEILYSRIFRKICREKSSFIKLGQE